MSENIDTLLENNSLKKEFEIRNLDLSQIFTLTPENLEYENEKLNYLLEWVQKYEGCRNRKKMENEGYEFPPIDFGISPDNDWYIFEKWINGLPIRKSTKEFLSQGFNLINPDDLTDDEIESELKKLMGKFEDSEISIALNGEIPARLVYNYLIETMNEEFEMLLEGSWTLDGCSGYCPGCFQRPWCKTGCELSWDEDEKAGEIFFNESAKKYVSASPVSLKILQRFKKAYDKKSKEFKDNREDSNQNYNDISNEPDPGESDLFDSEDDEIPY